jgi:hypothetical protein
LLCTTLDFLFLLNWNIFRSWIKSDTKMYSTLECMNLVSTFQVNTFITKFYPWFILIFLSLFAQDKICFNYLPKKHKCIWWLLFWSFCHFSVRTRFVSITYQKHKCIIYTSGGSLKKNKIKIKVWNESCFHVKDLK